MTCPPLPSQSSAADVWKAEITCVASYASGTSGTTCVPQREMHHATRACMLPHGTHPCKLPMSRACPRRKAWTSLTSVHATRVRVAPTMAYHAAALPLLLFLFDTLCTRFEAGAALNPPSDTGRTTTDLDSASSGSCNPAGYGFQKNTQTINRESDEIPVVWSGTSACCLQSSRVKL